MAPEIWNLSSVGQPIRVSSVEGYGPPSDLWSVGVILFQMLSGCVSRAPVTPSRPQLRLGPCAAGSELPRRPSRRSWLTPRRWHRGAALVPSSSRVLRFLRRRYLPFEARSQPGQQIRAGVLEMVRRRSYHAWFLLCQPPCRRLASPFSRLPPAVCSLASPGGVIMRRGSLTLSRPHRVRSRRATGLVSASRRRSL